MTIPVEETTWGKALAKKRVVVPQGMLKAAIEMMREWKGYPHPDSDENAAVIRSATALLETAVQWLSNNPIPLTVEMRDRIFTEFKAAGGTGQLEWASFLCREWQRRMFLAPDLERQSDDEIKGKIADLLRPECGIYASMIEAYRRGQKSRAS